MKKYLANDMKEALYRIKMDLGPEAVILNSRKVRCKGLLGLFARHKLEVTAAVDEPATINQMPRQLSEAAGAGQASLAPTDRILRGDIIARTTAQPAYNAAGAAAEKISEGTIMNDFSVRSNGIKASFSSDVNLRQELAEVKVLLHKIIKDKGRSGEDEVLIKWLQKLLDMDLDEAIAEDLIDDIKDKIDSGHPERDELIKAALTSRIAQIVEPAYQDMSYGKVLVFIGPTGVGKTTTLAKLAAQYTLFHRKNIAIITIDTYRIGAVEQLKTYGEIIGVHLEVVMTPEELHKSLIKHNDKDLILIDTAGRPSHNAAQVKELMEYIEVISYPRDIFLVLSATTKDRDLLKNFEGFGKIDINKIIFTKIDETQSLGSMLNVICHTNIPITYVTDGQSVPDDIEQVYPKKLAKLLFKGVDK
ncbi:flagellar biosynthesis protein FlhF [Desulfolucanica intricata]|uniref:flagellar biosynthesis protein FlhF n=1 Tax=Desulfolucanica intricata TaxID=1285191 RepID=UPI001EE41F21|nr:flagellar biosynthesis protein FlhF [Desulfolucanica intricata]